MDISPKYFVNGPVVVKGAVFFCVLLRKKEKKTAFTRCSLPLKRFPNLIVLPGR